MSEEQQNVELVKRGYDAFAAGDTVIVIGDVSLDGETSQGVNVYTIRDGKTAQVRVYGDTAMLERPYGKKQVSTR